jgi:ATP-binding cassette, subfamily B, heavy metal transporter
MGFWQIIKKVWIMLAPLHRSMLVIFGTVVLGQIISMAVPAILGKVIDAISSKQHFNMVLAWSGILLAVGLINMQVDHYRQAKEIKHLDYGTGRRISDISLNKLFSFSIGQHKNRHSGIKQSVTTDGQEALLQFVYVAEFQILPTIIQIMITLGVLLVMNWILSLIILAGLSLYVGFTFYLNNRMADELKEFEDLRHEDNKRYTELMRNIPLIKINGMEKEMINDYLGCYDKFSEFGIKMWLRYTRYSILRSLIVELMLCSILVVAGWSVLIVKANTVGDAVMFIIWTTRILGRLGSLGSIHRLMTRNYVTIKKFFALIETEPEIRNTEKPIKADILQSSIEFDNVSFCYPIREEVEDGKSLSDKNGYCALNSINLKIAPGEKVAIVGSSGAGKTTLVDLLLRAYDPDEGRVLIGGHDLRTIDLKSLLKSVGHVEQEVSLFDDTLKNNILFGVNGGSEIIQEEDLMRIIDESRVCTFFGNLEKEFNTIIGEKGIKLSGGEKQRVGIARAIAKTPKFLIFDEATSNLDSENEVYIQQAIKRAAKGRTTIIIAHRLSTVRDADKIIVMDKGRIVGEGTHDVLVDNCPEYQRLVINQLGAI